MVDDYSPSMDSDAELLDAIRRRDGRGAKLLILRHRPWALAYARKLGTGQDAEDIVQGVFIKLIEEPPQTLKNPTLEPLIKAELRFRMLAVKRGQKRRRVVCVPDRLSPTGTGLSSLLRRDRLSREVRGAMERLRTEHRRLLQRRYVDGMRPVEIAAELGRTPAAVRSAVFRAIEALRWELGVNEPS